MEKFYNIVLAVGRKFARKVADAAGSASVANY